MTTKRIVLGEVMVDETGKQASDLDARDPLLLHESNFYTHREETKHQNHMHGAILQD